MDKHGYFNFGPQNSHSKAVCDRAKLVIVEANQNQPRCLGGYQEAIHISEVDLIVEGENPALNQLKNPTPGAVDLKVAEYIVEEIHDGCLYPTGNRRYARRGGCTGTLPAYVALAKRYSKLSKAFHNHTVWYLFGIALFREINLYTD